MTHCSKCRVPLADTAYPKCFECDPAPFWAHFPLARLVPYVKARWFDRKYVKR